MPHHRVCPWWLGYLLANPIRRLWHDPAAILAPYAQPGMTVVEPGPGMGFFTLELARRVGPAGRVIAVDIQPKMLAALRRRAAKAGLAERVDARLAQPDSLNLSDLAGQVDFVLAFAVVHEMPSPGSFFAQIAPALRTSGRVLMAEPAGHVSATEFDAELAAAAKVGLVPEQRPEIRKSWAVLLHKGAT
jgi:ubiquinone/menaquinone biosynthesis C-methylase UbiE